MFPIKQKQNLKQFFNVSAIHKVNIIDIMNKSYMRYIIRNEYLYLMKINIIDHYDMWCSKIVNIKYKKHTYPKYIDYIKSLSLENNSNKIYSLLKNYENTNKTNKSLKSNRKIKYKYNKWSN